MKGVASRAAMVPILTQLGGRTFIDPRGTAGDVMNSDNGLHVLIDRWPCCFFANPRHRKPLKIGIADDIMAAGVLTTDELSRTLRIYTGHIRYLEACVAGASRIGLDGAPAGEVSPAAAQHARSRAEAARKRRAAQKAEAAPAPVAVMPAAAPANRAPHPPIAARAPGRRPLLTLRRSA